MKPEKGCLLFLYRRDQDLRCNFQPPAKGEATGCELYWISCAGDYAAAMRSKFTGTHG